MHAKVAAATRHTRITTNARPKRAEPPPGEGAVKFRMSHTKRMRALDRAAIRHNKDGQYQVSMTEVEETKSFLYIIPIFLCIVIWQVSCR
jgi:hypothetical protein